MFETIKIKRLRGVTLFKLIVVGSALGCALISTVLGIFAFFGAEVIQLNRVYITGLKGLLFSPFIGLLGGAFWGLFSAFFVYLGLRFLSLFHDLSIEYIPTEKQ